MNVTLEEFKGLIELAGYYSTPTTDRYNHTFTEHLIKQTEEDLKFRAFVKNHYPEALNEWHALQKVKGEE
jgi:hypothetical protein